MSFMREIMNQMNESATPMVRVEMEDETPFDIDLNDLFIANSDCIDEVEQQEIINALNTTGIYHGGGGAAAAWTITLAPVAQAGF